MMGEYIFVYESASGGGGRWREVEEALVPVALSVLHGFSFPLNLCPALRT